MRKAFCDGMVQLASSPETVFLTGDLGFMALEPLKNALGSRFINAGIAEQNMVTVAAGLAREGLKPWVYTIAPFCYARPFEQIRNDVSFHNLPVRLVGNGGGYGYGVMGPTHHAIEDYGVLLTLPNLRVVVPAFDEDVGSALTIIQNIREPVYLRLGRGEAPADYAVPEYRPWRQLTRGEGPVVVVIGPIVGTYLKYVHEFSLRQTPQLWVVTELPLSRNPPPEELLAQIARTKDVMVIEEHVARGGLGSELALWLLEQGLQPKRWSHRFANRHHFESYGSQTFLRGQSGLDAASIFASYHVV